MNNREALILLNSVEVIPSTRVKKMLEVFQEPTDVFQAALGELTARGGLTPFMARRVLDAPRRFSVSREMEEAQQMGVRIVTLLDDGYPQILKEIYDPPVVLYVKGGLLAADKNAVGVVGSRGASYYGLSCARQFSYELAQCGLTVVSGMARGIDTASHRAALDAGGRTLAILGSGLKKIYPPENRGLFEEIAQKSAVISQFPLDTPPWPQNFPVRNRIISGLSLGTLVVEASVKSGALITARCALEQGREVFAIPGKVSSPTSGGVHDLIKQGAKIVTDPKEILADLRPQLSLETTPSSVGTRAHEPSGLSPHEREVVSHLSDEPVNVDDLKAETGLDMADLLALLGQLELKKIIKQLPGKTFVKTT